MSKKQKKKNKVKPYKCKPGEHDYCYIGFSKRDKMNIYRCEKCAFTLLM